GPGLRVPTRTHHEPITGPVFRSLQDRTPNFGQTLVGPGGSLQAVTEKSLKGLGILQPLSTRPAPRPGPRRPPGEGRRCPARATRAWLGRTTGGLRPGPPAAAPRPVPGASGQVLPRLRYVTASPFRGRSKRRKIWSHPARIDRVGREVP